jgi:GAF domain-containing protein
MLKEEKLIGAIAIYSAEARPFTERHIDLVKNFANQAVIAIENTRLLNELRQRTDDLSEALEQQTATSEVLQVISSSPGDLEPVFRAMLENAVRICDAKFGTLFRYDGGFLHLGPGRARLPGWPNSKGDAGRFAQSREASTIAYCGQNRWPTAAITRASQIPAMRPSLAARGQPSWYPCSRMTS